MPAPMLGPAASDRGFRHSGKLAFRRIAMLGMQTLCRLSYSRSGGLHPSKRPPGRGLADADRFAKIVRWRTHTAHSDSESTNRPRGELQVVHGAGRPKSRQERFGAGVGCKRSKAHALAKAGPTREPRIATNDRFNQVTADAISGGGRRAYLPRSRSGSSGGLEDGTRVQTGESIAGAQGGRHATITQLGDLPR